MRKKGIPDMIFSSPIENFTQVPNELLRNPNISAQAKGILALLLSNKEGWYSFMQTIKSMMKNSDNFIRKTLLELGEQGYLIRVRLRNLNTKKYGELVWAYTSKPKKFDLENMVKIFKENEIEPVIDQSVIGREIVEELISQMTQTIDNIDEFPNPKNPKWESSKWEKPKMGNQHPNNINYKNINYKNINYKNTKNPSEENKIKKSIKERNKTFFPLSKKLAEIIKLNKNINTSPSKLNSWANEIRKLNEIEKVDIPRIKDALAWYEKNIGKPYVPVIESGYSLRQKFINLEAAIERDTNKFNNSKIPQVQKVDSSEIKKLIKDEYGELANMFKQNCYAPAKLMFASVIKDELDFLYTLFDLYADIASQQKVNLPKDLMYLFPSPLTLMQNYISWIKQNSWISNKNLSLLSIEHTLFQRFLKEETKKDNYERHPLTGKSSF